MGRQPCCGRPSPNTVKCVHKLKSSPTSNLALSFLLTKLTCTITPHKLTGPPCPQVAFDLHPLASGITFRNVMAVLYLGIFGAYWLYNLVHMLLDLRAASAIRAFTTDKLGLSERQLRTVTWPEVVRRIVQVLPACSNPTPSLSAALPPAMVPLASSPGAAAPADILRRDKRTP